MTDVRRATTLQLKDLIRKDPLCEMYRKQDSLDPAGIHLVELTKPLIHVEDSRRIYVSQVTVWAKVVDDAPGKFTLEIPHKAFENLPQAVRM